MLNHLIALDYASRASHSYTASRLVKILLQTIRRGRNSISIKEDSRVGKKISSKEEEDILYPLLKLSTHPPLHIVTKKVLHKVKHLSILSLLLIVIM